MKIIALTAENVKKLVAVTIRPDGNLVEITGKNGQGKSSVLDAIWWALAGTSDIQSVPIRKGAQSARIRLDLGEITVTRVFKAPFESVPYTTSIAVENADGSRFPSPQRMLDSFLGALSFDPMEFSRMKPEEQFDALRHFVPDVDFAAVEEMNRADYDKRTDLNRQCKRCEAAAAVIVVPDGTPTKEVDASALVDELQRSVAHNDAIARAKLDREQKQRDANASKAEGVRLRELAATHRKQADDADRFATEQLAKGGRIEREIDNLPVPPAPIDATEIRKRIDEAGQVKRWVEARALRREHLANAKALEAASEALTAGMEKRAADKAAAIAAAKLPVAGLGFGNGIVLLNGLPFDQASDAERLRTSLAIAMASNPKLRVLRVRDGSLLDEDSLRIISEMADAADYQVWIERVDSSGVVGFVLEDGHLKSTPSARAANG